MFGAELQRRLIGAEIEIDRVRDGKARGPAAGLEALGVGRVQHDVHRRMELDADLGREVVEVQVLGPGRIVAVGLGRIGEAQHRLAIGRRREDEGGRRIAARRLVVQSVAVGLVSLELLTFPGVAAAGGDGELLGELEVEVGVERLGPGRQVIGTVDHQKAAREDHPVVQVAAFLEMVGAQRIAQPIVDGLAGQLQLLGPLVLRHVEGGLEDGHRRAVEIHAGIPMQLAIGADQLQVGAADLPVDGPRDAPVPQLGEAVAGLVGGVDVAGEEARVIGKAVVAGVPISVDAADGGKRRHRAGNRPHIQARAVAERAEPNRADDS